MRRDRAFTLVELLVVIGIIAVLIAMLLPVLSRVRKAAVQVTCSSNIRQFGTGLIAYSTQFRGMIPIGVATSSIQSYWMPIFTVNPIMRPLVAGPWRLVGSTVKLPGSTDWGGTPIRCPNNAQWYAQGDFNGVSYAIMIPSTKTTEYYHVDIDDTHSFTGRRLGKNRDPSGSILAVDSVTASLTGTPRNLRDTPEPGICVAVNGVLNRGGTIDLLWASHPDNACVSLFCDGHAEAVRTGELMSRYKITNYLDNDKIYHH